MLESVLAPPVRPIPATKLAPKAALRPETTEGRLVQSAVLRHYRSVRCAALPAGCFVRSSSRPEHENALFRVSIDDERGRPLVRQVRCRGATKLRPGQRAEVRH